MKETLSARLDMWAHIVGFEKDRCRPRSMDNRHP